MESLPVELLSAIATQIQEWNISHRPFSEITETSEDGTIGWLTHTQVSRETLCTFRLVSRACYASSFHAFGALLGDRVFRITRCGWKDLEALSSYATLQPHIRTLTFGNARFSVPHRQQNKQLVDLTRDLGPEGAPLLAAYGREAAWQRLHGGVRGYFSEAMVNWLRKLPNLRSVRLLLSDRPGVHNHLGGWLSSADKERVAQATSQSPALQLEDESIYSIQPGTARRLNVLAYSLQQARTPIEDLRVGCGYGLSSSDLYDWMKSAEMTRCIRHLRLDLDPQYLEPSCTYHKYKDIIFSKLPGLRSVSLSLIHNGHSQLAEVTSELMLILRSLPCLENVTLRCEWTYAEDDIIALLLKCENLHTLALKGPVLARGSWASVVGQLMLMRPSNLKHLQFSNISMIEESTKLVPAFDAPAWQQFIKEVRPAIEEHGKGTVHLSSGKGKYIFRPPQV
jgi:hypothetical protein